MSDVRELTGEEYEAWGEVWAVASDFVDLFGLYEQWSEMGKDEYRLAIAAEIRAKLPELREVLTESERRDERQKVAAEHDRRVEEISRRLGRTG